MIKLKESRGLIKETTAPYEYTDENGETQTEQIRVRYISHSIEGLRTNASRLQSKIDAAREKGEPLWLSETLPYQIESLPDITDLDGKPLTVVLDKNGEPTAKTLKNFEAIPRTNLAAIQKAIVDDLTPKETPVGSQNG